MIITLIKQLSILVLIKCLPVSTLQKTVVGVLFLIYSRKTWFIMLKILELVTLIAGNRAKDHYKAIANSIFRDNFRFRANFRDLPSSPTILVSTYPKDWGSIEYLAPALFPVPVCLMAVTNARAIMSKVYPDAECCYIPSKVHGRYEITRDIVREKLKDMHVMMYVEDHQRRHGRRVANLRKGAFWIAKELGATVTPVVISSVHEEYGAIPDQNFDVYVGPTMQVDDPASTLIRVRTLMRQKKAS